MAKQKTALQQIVHQPLGALKPYARNARTHSAAQVEQIVRSIKEFGWTNPILVDNDGGVIAGHGRLLAAHRMGMETVPTLNVGHMTPAQRRAYILADNQLALNAGWDQALLRLELAELRMDEFDLTLTGFAALEIDALFAEPDDEKSKALGRLAEQFMVPPFSVLSARDGWWQERKRTWLALGIKSELGRAGALVKGSDSPNNIYAETNSWAGNRGPAPGGNARPRATNYAKRQRGTGNGRPMTKA